MRTHGRPVLAGFAGFFFGLSLSLLLLVSGAVKLDSIVLVILPILFLILGVVWAFWAPVGRGVAPAGPAGTATGGRAGFSGGTLAGPSGQGPDQGGSGARTI